MQRYTAERVRMSGGDGSNDQKKYTSGREKSKNHSLSLMLPTSLIISSSSSSLPCVAASAASFVAYLCTYSGKTLEDDKA